MVTTPSDDEKHLLKKLKLLRESISPASLPPPVVDRVMVRHLVTDYLRRSGITPAAPQIDALIDDIAYYIRKTFEEFKAFLHQGEEEQEG